MKNVFIFFFLLISTSLFAQQKVPTSKNIITTGCEVVEKSFVNKAGKASDYKEIYLRCSVQDYYIKFCESKVSSKTMKKYVNKGVTVKYEVRDGEWDKCKGDPLMQSRVGTYAIVLAIKKPKKGKIRTKG